MTYAGVVSLFRTDDILEEDEFPEGRISYCLVDDNSINFSL